MKIVNVDVKKVKIPRFKFQLVINSEDIKKMVKSIKKFDVLQPVIVRRGANGYELLAGEHRLKAAKKAKINKIPARVVKVDDVDGERIGIEENLRRRNLSAYEFTEAMSRLKELDESKHGKKGRGRPSKLIDNKREKNTTGCRNFAEKTAKQLGINERTVQRAVARSEKLSVKAKEALKEKKISGSQADVLTKLPVKKQDRVLPRVVNTTQKNTVKLIDVMERGKKRKKVAPDILLKRLMRVLKESSSLAERLNLKLMSAIDLVDDLNGGVQVGGLKGFMIGFELSMTHEYLSKLKVVLGAEDADCKEGKN